ncbi:MAG: hydantoinase/oxoprolinase family protein [Solirubrobacterales bacterium]|nr:hydantoinase/oxoprolinase family protein [Solirubrobacterales bacterium]
MSEDIVAVDVGGTFTDICVLRRETGELRVAKVPSTPNPIEGVVAGVAAAGIDLSKVALFSHGTTVATNALITRNFPPAAMVTTKGFRDVIEIRRGTKEDLWDAYQDVAPPPIRRRHRFEVTERVDYSGTVLEPLDEEGAREVARLLGRRGIETVAVCFINSYANQDHELRMREILEEELDGVLVSTSSEVLPEIFEHERFSTTIANAVLQPLVGGYIRDLESELKAEGYDGDLVILHSGGGVMTPETADRWAVRLAGSGIAAGAIASRHIGQLCGFENTIGFDMGGTSTDISLVYEGEARTTNEWSVQYGYPIRFPSIEVMTIGAGGGSLAWIDEAGALRNGPQSAGADPGPACYGQGGTEPTNTDAHLVLGGLGKELIDGAMSLDPAKAEEALRTRLAEPLGLGVTEAAAAALSVANANMADAIRLISVRRGYDPREFALVCFGGAGPLHGAALARELSIPTVLVPPNPGTTSALGCLLVDIRHDFFTLLLGTTDQVDAGDVEAKFAELTEQAMERMRAEGVAPDAVELSRTIDMRYAGQWRSIAVPVDGEITSLDDVARTFEDEHEREHSYRHEGSPIEVYRLNLRATGATQKAELARHERENSMPEPVARRPVHFGGEDIDTPVYRRADIPAGATFNGPAVLEQLDSTVVVPSGSAVEIDEWLNIRMSIEEAE